MAWNVTRNEFLVVYERRVNNDYDVYGQRLNANGAEIGAEFPIRAQNNVDERNPEVAYSPATQQYVIAMEHGSSDVIMATIACLGTFVGAWFLDVTTLLRESDAEGDALPPRERSVAQVLSSSGRVVDTTLRPRNLMVLSDADRRRATPRRHTRRSI